MKKVLNMIEKYLIYLILLLFAVMVATIFLQVVLRFVFNTGTTWAEEVARYSFAWLVLLGAVVSVRKGRHMRMGFLIDLFPPMLKAITQTILDILLVTFLIVLSYNGILLVQVTHRQLSTGTSIPMSIPYASIPVGGILMLVFLIESIVDRMKKSKQTVEIEKSLKVGGE